MAADAIDVEIDLASRLASIEQVEDPVTPGDFADLLGRVHQAAEGRDMGEGNQAGLRCDGRFQCGKVHLTGPVVVDDIDLDAGAGLHLQQGNVVGDILRTRGDHPVPGPEGDCVKGHVPCTGGILDIGNFIRARADKRRDGGVEVLNAGCGPVGRLIASHFGLKIEMAFCAVRTVPETRPVPALLKWITRSAPGVSARRRSVSLSVQLAGWALVMGGAIL